MKVSVLGYGYWGPNLVRNFLANGHTVKYIVDNSDLSRQKAKKAYPSVIVSSDADASINDTDVDAIVIALPVRFHFEYAKKALLAGKHVLVEKPMTSSSDEANELIDIAVQKKHVLMPDHTFLYTGAVRKIKEIITSGELGDVLYFDSTRVNLGLFQSDVNVLWDLAPHDISILAYLVNEYPKSIVATGSSHTDNEIENLANMTMYYNNSFYAHVGVSWVSPVKIRKILIGGTKKMIVYDDIEPTEKVKMYDSGYVMTSAEEQNKFKIDYRVGDIYIPKLDTAEALFSMVADFTKAVESNDSYTPVSNMHLGASVVNILDAAERSIKDRSIGVKL